MISSDFTQTDRFERLAMICRALTGDLEAAEVAEIVMRQSMAGTGASGAALAFRRGDHVLTPMSAGTTAHSLKRLGVLTVDGGNAIQLPIGRRNPVCLAIQHGQPVWLPNREVAVARFPDLRMASTGSQGWAAVPLLSNGRPFGALSLSFRTPPTFDPAGCSFILAVADVAALALAREAAQKGHIPLPALLSPLVEDLVLRPQDAALVVDEDGVIVAANEHLAELVGQARIGLIGRSVESLMPEATQADHVQWRRRYLDDPVPRPFGSGLDIAIQPADGHPISVEVSLTPLATDQGAYVLAVIRPRA